MKSQIFGVIIFGLLLIFLGMYTFLSILGIDLINRQKKLEYTTEDILFNFKIILERYIDPLYNLSIKDLIIYAAISRDKKAEQEIKNFFQRFFGSNWKIDIKQITIIRAWPVKVYFKQMKLWDWDVSQYDDLKDNYGYYWYQIPYDDSNWIIATIPFYQGEIVRNLLGIDLRRCKDLNSLFGHPGIYMCPYSINPFKLLINFEACKGGKKPMIKISSGLPKNIDIGNFGYIFLNYTYCNNAHREMVAKIYKNLITYNTITDIEKLAKSTGFSGKYFITYMRGWFYVPSSCKETYLEAIWNEITALYINEHFIFANCYNSNNKKPLLKLPDPFCNPLKNKECLHGTPTWGIVRVNITKYITKNKYNLLAFLFGVPHDKNNPPSCYKNIDKYYDLSINTLGAVRIFCIDHKGDLIELNEESALPPKTIYSLGYNKKNSKEKYVIIVPYTKYLTKAFRKVFYEIKIIIYI